MPCAKLPLILANEERDVEFSCVYDTVLQYQLQNLPAHPNNYPACAILLRLLQ